MAPPRIRGARSEEAAALSSLAWRAKEHWGYGPSFMAACRDELTLCAAQLRGGLVFVREARGEPLGFYSLEPLSAGEVELGHLFVEPRQMGCGHGRALLAHACVEARRRGFRVLLIQGDPHATDFYTRCGARRVGQSPSLSIPGRTLPTFQIELGGGVARGRSGAATDGSGSDTR